MDFTDASAILTTDQELQKTTDQPASPEVTTSAPTRAVPHIIKVINEQIKDDSSAFQKDSILLQSLFSNPYNVDNLNQALSLLINMREYAHSLNTWRSERKNFAGSNGVIYPVTTHEMMLIQAYHLNVPDDQVYGPPRYQPAKAAAATAKSE